MNNKINLKIDLEYNQSLIHLPFIEGVLLSHFDLNKKYIKKENGNLRIEKGFFNVNAATENGYRYKIIKRNDSSLELTPFTVYEPKYGQFYDEILTNTPKENTICLIMESPHNQEFYYVNKDIFSIGPAQEKTGENIKNYLQKVLEKFELSNFKLELDTEYNLLLINPIPYQTSLSFFHGQPLHENVPYQLLRDNTWLGLWYSDSSFESEMIRILSHNNVSIILNCCTKTLQPHIAASLLKNRLSFVNFGHPSSWHNHGRQTIVNYPKIR